MNFMEYSNDPDYFSSFPPVYTRWPLRKFNRLAELLISGASRFIPPGWIIHLLNRPPKTWGLHPAASIQPLRGQLIRSLRYYRRFCLLHPPDSKSAVSKLPLLFIGPVNWQSFFCRWYAPVHSRIHRGRPVSELFPGLGQLHGTEDIPRFIKLHKGSLHWICLPTCSATYWVNFAAISDLALVYLTFWMYFPI